MNTIKLALGLIFFWSLNSFAERKIEYVPGEFLIKLKHQYPVENVLKNPDQFGIRLADLGQLKNTIKELNVLSVQRSSIETVDSVVERVSTFSYVEYIEPNYIYRAVAVPNDPELDKLWGLHNFGQQVNHNYYGQPGIDIDAEKAWDVQTGSKKIIVGIVDTGINYNDPNLKNNIWVNEKEFNGKAGVDDDQNGYIDDIHGFNFRSGSTTTEPLDDNHHGTHCAGTIGASGNDGIGVVGVNWNVSMMALKFLDSNGSGNAEDATKAILYGIKMHANILSNSWGSFGESKTILSAVQEANKAGILFVAAAGNDSTDIDQYTYFPAGFKVANVLPVAAIDNRGKLAYFSNWGVETVPLAAPGLDVYSTVLDGLGYLSGTSMATPHVSGVAALVLAQSPNLPLKDLIARLTLTSKPIESLYRKTKYGLVNAYNAVTNTPPPPADFDPHYWQQKPMVLETLHPYKNNSNLEWTISIPEAKEMAIFFDKVELQGTGDNIYVRTAEGNLVEQTKSGATKYYSNNIKGNIAKINFSSDSYTRRYGFKISHVAWR